MRKAKITVAILALVIIGAFTYLAVNSGVTAKNLELKTIKLQSTEEKLKSVDLQVEQLKTQSSTDKAKQQQLEKEKQDLEAQLQAKADNKAKLEVAAAEAEKQLTASHVASAATVRVPLPAGSHTDWMAQAGIAESDYGYVDYIVSHESGWNPNAVNASSGAEGLPQALPYSKTGCGHGDPVCQLQWATAYAVGRYGSWSGAYNFWTINRWW